MERPKIETVDVTVPTGYVITLKKKLTYGENQKRENAIYGDIEVGGDAAEFKMKVAQASETEPVTIFYHIVSWDATENNEAIPVSLDNVKNILFEEDIKLLYSKIKAFEPNKKKEIGSSSSL